MSNALSDWTTFGIGGNARAVVIADTRGKLIDEHTLVLGRGSNVLASDSGYDGTVTINRYAEITRMGGVVTVGSGLRLAELTAYLAENGLSGLEWACGIPGSVGGAVKMNAGAFGGEIKDSLICAEIFIGGRIAEMPVGSLGMGYRSSLVNGTVVSATFALRYDDPATIRKRMRAYAARRRSAQPIGKCAGSIFKNPPGISVGKALDECGLKGLRRGGAQISQAHANIIVNVGGATAKDVIYLISVMRDELTAKGIPAHEEIIYIGDF